MSGWVANDSYRTMQAKREAVEQARTISKIDSTMKNVQVRYVPELGVMSIKGNANEEVYTLGEYVTREQYAVFESFNVQLEFIH